MNVNLSVHLNKDIYSFTSPARILPELRTFISVDNTLVILKITRLDRGDINKLMSTIATKPVYLYNTLTRRKDLFKPLNPPRVGIYNCGPTVYKDIHIGNLRSFTTTDWLRRILEYNGYDVYLVRNITDVGHLHEGDDTRNGEDKIEHEARTTGRSAYEIAASYTEQYLHDVAAMNILPPHQTPRATDHIPEMQAMIEKLIEHGLAYITN